MLYVFIDIARIADETRNIFRVVHVFNYLGALIFQANKCHCHKIEAGLLHV